MNHAPLSTLIRQGLEQTIATNDYSHLPDVLMLAEELEARDRIAATLSRSGVTSQRFQQVLTEQQARLAYRRPTRR